MRGLGVKEGGCGGVWVLGIVLEGDRPFYRQGRSHFLATADKQNRCGWIKGRFIYIMTNAWSSETGFLRKYFTVAHRLGKNPVSSVRSRFLC